MKKLLVIFAAAVALLCLSACTKSEGIFVNPTTMTLKVGETGDFTIGTWGSLNVENIHMGLAVGADKYISLDEEEHTVKGIAPGTGDVAFVYWAEGAKQGSYSTSLRVTVTN